MEGVDGIESQVRRVGYVPQAYITHDTAESERDGLGHVPGLVPDPLFPEKQALIGPFVNQAFWITLHVSEQAAPGKHTIRVRLTCEGLAEDVALHAVVNVKDVVLKPRQHFHVTHWWNADCLYDWYKVEPFGDEFFDRLRPYLKNMYEHGSNVIYVPILNIRREITDRPPQLLIVKAPEPGKYEFDFSRVRRFVHMAKEIGFELFEWTHFWTYGHLVDKPMPAGTPTRIYTEREGRMVLLFPEDLDATGDVFQAYMQQFLPAMKEFLLEEGIMDQSLFHICDEPPEYPEAIESYRRARKMLEKIDPTIKVMDALYHDVYTTLGLVDYPIPQAPGACRYLEKGIPHWVYYCLSPQGPYINRFFDTILTKIRMQGLIFYKLRTLGFLHWGFNYWYHLTSLYDQECQKMLDPFADGSAGGMAPYGDPFVVYPGPEGPIDSIRWEVFAEAMQDYALLQTLGINPDDEVLKPIQSYADFPKSETWFQDTIKQLLKG
ncbi:DUF4091 domain-containing protein [Paenibacillus sp. CC-CFT747]|nr:DUF4091 domain-containing protein [Paenibacillus sp. CC-CFT747]